MYKFLVILIITSTSYASELIVTPVYKSYDKSTYSAISKSGSSFYIEKKKNITKIYTKNKASSYSDSGVSYIITPYNKEVYSDSYDY